MTKKNKKTLFLISGILTGIVFISSILDSEPGSLFGSIWLFRIGWFIMSASSFGSYYQIMKSEKKSKSTLDSASIGPRLSRKGS